MQALAHGWRVFVLGSALLVIAHLCWPPVYAFPPPSPFHGARWYNPYERSTDGAGIWLRANFHAHSWGLFWTPQDPVPEIYGELGYDVPTLSNSMAIAPRRPGEDLYIPTYEHGYGWRKWHFAVIGADRVDYLDFPLFQSASIKQYRLDRLRSNARLLVINHPNLLGAFSL